MSIPYLIFFLHEAKANEPLEMAVEKGRSITISCQGINNPVWRKDFNDLLPSERVKIVDGDIEIHPVLESDAGTYECRGVANGQNVKSTAKEFYVGGTL